MLQWRLAPPCEGWRLGLSACYRANVGQISKATIRAMMAQRCHFFIQTPRRTIRREV